MRKITAVLVLVALFVAPACAMDAATKAYIAGIEDGFYLGELAWQARGNATAAQAYNIEIGKYNAFLKSILSDDEYRMAELAALPMPDNSWMPKVLRESNPGANPWSGSRVDPASTISSRESGIVHEIDGRKKVSAKDENALTDAELSAYQKTDQAKTFGTDYLGGV